MAVLAPKFVMGPIFSQESYGPIYVGLCH